MSSRTTIALQRILFVDDDPYVLRALERQLRAHSDRWTSTFVSGGAEAIAQLGRERYDILVTDMLMPRVDGAAVLQHAYEHHPEVIRIVLSGHTEFEHAVRSVSLAHQRMQKPWNRDELVSTLGVASNLKALVGDELIRRCVSQVESLPSSPRAYERLAAALDAPNASLATVASVIEKDMAMSAKLLQLANSAFVGARREITQVTDAVRTVGLDAIRHYILSPFLHVFAAFAPDAGEDDQRFSHLGIHATFTAHLAATLARSEATKSKAFTAGLLHDIGSLVLLTRIPDVARAISVEAAEKDCAIEDLELRTLGVTHAEVGAYLLGLWGVPSEICNAVSRHHERVVQDDDNELVLTLRIANWLAREHELRTKLRIDPGVLALDFDEALLRAFGVAGDIPRLLAIAADCDARLRQTSIAPPGRIARH